MIDFAYIMAGTVENPRLDYSRGYKTPEGLTVESFWTQLSQKALLALDPVLTSLKSDPAGTETARGIEDIFAGNDGEVEVPQEVIQALLQANLLAVTEAIDRQQEINEPSGWIDIIGERDYPNGARINGRVSGYKVCLPDVEPKNFDFRTYIELRAKTTPEGIYGTTHFDHWILSRRTPSIPLSRQQVSLLS